MATDKSDSRPGAMQPETRSYLARGFTLVEDIVYIGLGLLLSVSALTLLGSTAVSFAREVTNAPLTQVVITLLDRLLLALMVIELLYTVQVSFREHAIAPEPFLIVGLVAATRRILVLTAELTGLQEKPEAVFRFAMIELGILTVMVVALVGSLLMLRSGRQPAAVATRT